MRCVTVGAERFLREIDTAASVTHPHIVPVYDSGEAAGFLSSVMPCVESESPRDRLEREGQLPLSAGAGTEVGPPENFNEGTAVKKTAVQSGTIKWIV